MMKFMTLDSESQGQFVFPLQNGDEFQMDDRDLLKLIPFGIQLSADGMRPVLILKDEKAEHSMPVPLNPLEAGIALTQSNKTIAPATAHRVTEVLFEALNIKIQQCVFVELKGAYQYVHLILTGHPAVKLIKVRADEAMSLCLHLNVPIYATASFMARSRVLTSEMTGIMKGVVANPEIMAKTHKYVM